MFLEVPWPGGSWEATAKYAVAILLIYLAALWLTLVFWTYRDIRQRSRDPFVQSCAVLLVLIFFLPGHWLYLILRPRYTMTELYERSLEEEALLQELEDQKACPTCKRRVYDDYLMCPSCRTQLKEPCRSCSKPLSYAWVVCPYCGLEKPPRPGFGPQPARSAPPRPAEAPRPAQAPQPAAATMAPAPITRPRPAPAPLPAPAPAAATASASTASTPVTRPVPQPAPQPAPQPQRAPAPQPAAQPQRAPSRDPFVRGPATDEGPVIGESSGG